MWIVRPADRESAPAGVPTRHLVRDLQATRGKALNVQEPAPQEQRRPRRVGLLFGVAGAVFVVDVITKIIVVATLTPGHQDRKSTRLNSSHLGISYAVFC